MDALCHLTFLQMIMAEKGTSFNCQIHSLNYKVIGVVKTVGMSNRSSNSVDGWYVEVNE